MDPLKASKRGIDPSDVRITSRLDRHGGKWVTWVPDAKCSGGRRVLTESHDIFAMCHWLAQLRRLNPSDA